MKYQYLWTIKTIRWHGEKKEGDTATLSSEYIVAPTIEDVWEHLALDRQDEGVEIEAIVREVPVLKVISDYARIEGLTKLVND